MKAKTILSATVAIACALGAAAEPQLYMAGDSIMADYKPEAAPQCGWGQALRSLMKDSSRLNNCARSGWSARRFRESGRWESRIASRLNAGDWVIVSFGHNDSNKKRNAAPKNDYSTPEEYKAFLSGFAADVRAKGAGIVFATSIAHSDGFAEKDGVMSVDGGAKGLGPYVGAMREVAAEIGVPLLDLNRYAEENLPKLGMSKAKALYMFLAPGESPNYPDGKMDAAHICEAGALFYAKAAVEMARRQGLPLAAEFFAAQPFSAAVWRGETAHVELPAGVAEALAAHVGAAQDGVTVTLGRYDEVAYELQPDGAEKRSRPDVYRELSAADGRLATVCRISASADARPGRRSFGPLELTVVDRVLPPAKDWRYFLDLWQHPWAVSRYFGVEPFSKEHYAKMAPVWRALADCGCKALTVTLLDLPWNHQCYDGYYSMVGRVKKTDGTWVFDYSLFDEYVAFGRSCGLGPDIACYTMCPWRYRATWKEEQAKDGGETAIVERREKILPGTPEFEDYWGPFLVDFAAHLKAKGWFDDAYIAMDERGPEDVRKIADLVQRKAPGLKIAMAGKTKPSAFEGIKIENFSQNLIRLNKEFLPELKPRREKGFKTTFYVCCSARHPNTFLESPADEGFWLGAYPVMAGFDGFLRWAANSWPEDPYKDASFRTKDWKAGDTFLIYPGGELSSRLVELRAGIVAAEKLRILREAGVVSDADVARLAGPYGFRGAVKNAFDFTAFRREVEAFVNADARSGM